MVSVVCGTVYLANQKIAQAINNSRSAFERGHLIQMPGCVNVDFLIGVRTKKKTDPTFPLLP